MIAANDLRAGMAVRIEKTLFWVVDFQHIKMGRGSAFVRLKLKEMGKGAIIERTFRPEEKFDDVYIERRSLQFLYKDDKYHFMDENTFEQMEVEEQAVGKAVPYLKEGISIEVLFSEGTPIDVNIPNFIDLKITQTEPGIRGDTVSGATKPATLETGLVVEVPLFIEQGDVIRVDIRTNKYVERAKK